MNRYRALVALLCAVVLASCDKNAVQEITGPLPTSRIKFFHFGVNAPGVNFYANTTKMTATTSATGVESTTGVVYGGVGSGGLYSAIAPGPYTLSGKIAATVDKDLAIASVNATIADGKAYSLYLSGFYNTTTKTVEGFVVEDNFPATIDFSQATVRFVNAISNANPLTLYAKNTLTGTEVPVGAAVAYKAGGAFVTLPNGTYDLNARYTGGTANVITRTAVSFSAGRVYTIGARGDITITSTTATNRPFLDNTTNR
ncbi:MAG: DUF4397 domain-containing protein [Gemmatimonadetes bacterium]|nr:DUF4397 domain-containing protein [Gemmatimonadota bacterium]MBK9410329.1 DUF4397 domain-containing protein [Gemmatimonadota bacterium]